MPSPALIQGQAVSMELASAPGWFNMTPVDHKVLFDSPQNSHQPLPASVAFQSPCQAILAFLLQRNHITVTGV